jgi:hypothetical protein
VLTFGANGVITVKADENQGFISDNMLSTSNALPGMVTLVSPSGSVPYVTPTFKWQPLDNILAYRILVERDIGSGIWIGVYATVEYGTKGVCSDTICTVTPAKLDEQLTVSYRYRFKVRARNSDGLGPWSNPMTFQVTDSIGTVPSNKPTYVWKEVSGAIKYNLRVYSVTASRNALVVNVPALPACAAGTCKYTPSVGLNSGSYKFNLKSYNPAGWSIVSGWKIFKFGTPGAPTLISPSGTIGTSTPKYKWNAVSGTTVYRLSVYSITTSSYVINVNIKASTYCSGGTCTFKPSTVLSQGDYRFKVRGRNSIGWGQISAWMKFKYGPPDAPTLISPNTAIGTSTPTYKWKAVSGASIYRLSVYSVDSSSYVINLNVKASTFCSGTNCGYKSATALSTGEYRFKVRAYNAVGWGPISNWMKFRYGPPDAPTLISPSGTISTSTPTYKWNAVSGVSVFRLAVYSVDLSTYVNQINVQATTICSGGTCSYKPSNVLTQGNYRFFVRGRNAVGWGDKSSWMKFRYGPPDSPTLVAAT